MNIKIEIGKLEFENMQDQLGIKDTAKFRQSIIDTTRNALGLRKHDSVEIKIIWRRGEQ